MGRRLSERRNLASPAGGSGKRSRLFFYPGSTRMFVLKFGGTSVGSLERVREAAAIAAAQPAPRAVVVSAVSGVTNLLLEAGRQAASGDRGSMASTVQAIVDKHTAILAGLPDGADRKDTEIRLGDLHTALELTLADVAVAGELSAKNSDRVVSTGE